MLEIVQILGPMWTVLALLVICLTLLGLISRIVMAFEKRPKQQEQPEQQPEKRLTSPDQP